MNSRHIAFFHLALLALCAGCRDVVDAHVSLSGTYVLQSINGAALPATAAQGGGNQYIVLADSLEFLPDSKVRRSYTVRRITSQGDTTFSQVWTFPYSIHRNTITIGNTQGCGDPGANCAFSRVWTFPYSMDRNTITIGNTQGCGDPGANCVGFETGIIEGSSLHIAARLFWPGEPQFLFALR